jgi:hypothetical protein
VPLFSFRSEAAALAGTLAGSSGNERSTSFSAAEPSRQLLRTLSNSNHRRNAGALAAAGLLQMSPGLYLTTPPLLGKLLSKKARSQVPGSTAAAGPQYHHGRVPSHDSLASWEVSQLSVGSAATEQQQQQQQLDASSTCLTARSRAGSWDAAGQSGSAGSVWPLNAGHGRGSGDLSSWGVDEDAAAAPPAAAAAYDGTAAVTTPRSVQLHNDAVAVTPAAARLVAADAAFSSIGSSPAAGVSPVAGMPGGFGKILVRRRFARNLQPVALTIKR